MLSPSLDFTDFIHQIADLDYRDMIAQADLESDALEAMLYAGQRSVRGIKAARAGRYLAEIGRFLFFMRRGMMPSGVAQGNVALYRQVCKALVAKGQLEPSRLDGFTKRPRVR
jgi:hypothetical protein